MCGRFNLQTPAAQLVELFDLVAAPALLPRYNIAPTQSVAAVRTGDAGRELVLLHWGLIPSWAKDAKIGNRMINARSETVAEKPSFRAAFKRRRCLIPADGFYEWKSTGGKIKQPYHIQLQNRQTFAFAGLWEHWSGGNGAEIESCTIITTPANELIRELHDRMPVILPADAYADWLDPQLEDREHLERLLTAYPSDEMTYYPVSTAVNNPRYDQPDCLDDVSP